jgi:hypothetical protein
MDRSLVEQVWARAGSRCEYCQVSQEHDELTFEIEHIVSKKHEGKAALSNLGLAGFACNHYKGTDISGRDSKTRKLVPLFDPRKHKWSYHFRWEGPYLIGRTAIGRVTVALLRMNLPHRVELRQELIDEGLFPPE